MVSGDPALATVGPMTEQRGEALEAAQNVVDTVSSYQAGAETQVVRTELESGLREAGVTVPQGEVERLAQQISDGEQTPEVTEVGTDGEG